MAVLALRWLTSPPEMRTAARALTARLISQKKDHRADVGGVHGFEQGAPVASGGPDEDGGRDGKEQDAWGEFGALISEPDGG